MKSANTVSDNHHKEKRRPPHGENGLLLNFRYTEATYYLSSSLRVIMSVLFFGFDVNILLLVFIVFAGEDGVQQDAENRGDCQTGKVDCGVTDVENDSACCAHADADAATRMIVTIIRLRAFVRSTWFSMRLRTPIAEIIP